ncbi:UvrD-helicase domain-containing protein [Cupriavidus pinatubonensis]|uniref:DNA 3'-5' helicase II n=1 Tax=Cupriavidus pinatubonensis TaxID=248026 RepID=A0ABM8XGB8_9BURK|nr:UvrD-helicase domain-containing protein [Cupriavidus pinatubonensis]CAG9179204.1 hypothetical protein LMG23994_04095 [Cupriavidus pinatubonensis]
MSLPILDQSDLDAVAELLPSLSLGDGERRTVLLECGTRDINAAPGSGKTTLLAAKLLMLSRKWPYERRGVCVISHTNVARDEIQRRLSASADGARLLAYPHFIGTIHAFVNQFLALPLLRSEGLEVDSIDNDIFERRALALARKVPAIRFWMGQDASVEDMVRTLVFDGAELTLACEEGKLPKASSKTYPSLLGIKHELAANGIFRHADMFALAEKLLMDHPYTGTLLSKRFPLVFIDEMQDTSWAQEEMLNRVFDNSVVIQRFGDVNQRILSSDKDAVNLTFPRAECLSISTSKRFGPAIAKAVSSVQLNGTPVIGDQPDTHAPTLILYSENRVSDVIHCFGGLVLDAFSDEELQAGEVRVLCARKQSSANAAPGRHLGDYWPPFGQEMLNATSRADRLWALLADPPGHGSGTYSLAARAGDIRRASLLVLRSAESPFIVDIRDGNQLVRNLERDGHETVSLRRLFRDLALATGLASSLEARGETISKMFAGLVALLPEGMTEEKFRGLSVFAEPEMPVKDTAESRTSVVERDGRSAVIQIGTTASMKGETHLATLVLESYGGRSRRFDLAEALPVIAGANGLPKKMSETLKGQFRNLYVAMSRPTSLLCLAANQNRVASDDIGELVKCGWRVRVLN